MKLPRVVPPAWRSLANVQRDPWVVVALLAGAAGLSWALSPAGLADRYVRRREPTPTGRALGIAAGMELGPTVDPLGILTAREELRLGIGTAHPVYRAGRMPAYRHAPGEVTIPIRVQDFRPLAVQAPVRQGPPKPGVTITAADVLRPARREG